MENGYEGSSVRVFVNACRQLVLVVVIGQACLAQTVQRRQTAPDLILSRIMQERQNIQRPTEIKCGTSLVAWAYIHWRQLSSLDKQDIARALQRPVRQKDRLSPSGRFRIHYDTTGIDAPALITSAPSAQRIANTYEQFVDSVAKFFEIAWETEIDTMGFSAPPSDGQKGGGPEFDVYLEDLGPGNFGETSWEQDDLLDDGARQRYATYITIDNDFLGLRTPGMDGLRITAAHEFHHAVQVGVYGIWTTVPNSDFYFYELTSVWMEHILYPSIHDYYFDLPTYFRWYRDLQNRSFSFTEYSPPTYAGYERAIWAIFLAKRFGRDVIREVWEGMKVDPFLQSANKVLERHGSSIESEFSLFSYWNFFTADRADPVRFYDEGASYPRYVPNATVTFDGLTSEITTSGYPLSTQLYQFSIPGDTLIAVIANVDADHAYADPLTAQAIGLTLTSGNLKPPYQRLAKGYLVGFASSQPNAWRALYLESMTGSNASAAPQASPNPLRLSQDSQLNLPTPGVTSSSAHVYMLGSSLDLVYSADCPVTEFFGKKVITIPAEALRSKVSSGIYFVVARCGDQEFKWKVAILQ
jgi:hypothetical protein